MAGLEVLQPNAFTPTIEPPSKMYLARICKYFGDRLKDGTAFAGCVAIGAELAIEWKQGSLKKEERIMEKVLLQSGRFDRIRDYARGCFLVDRLSEIARIVERLNSGIEYDLIRAKNRFSASYDARESSGYRDYQLLARIDGGWIIEIQIIPRDMYEIKSKLGVATTPGAAEITGHGAYKEYRAIQEARKRLGRSGRSASISMDLPLANLDKGLTLDELSLSGTTPAGSSDDSDIDI